MSRAQSERDAMNAMPPRSIEPLPAPDAVVEQQVGDDWSIVREFRGHAAMATALREAQRLKDEGRRIDSAGVLRFAKQYRVRLV